MPFGVAVDASSNVYVSEKANSDVRIITSAGLDTTLANGFYYPVGIAVDASGNVYVADAYINEIRKITPGGVATTLAGSTAMGFADGTGSAARFEEPWGVAVDASSNVYVADTYSCVISKISPIPN